MLERRPSRVYMREWKNVLIYESFAKGCDYAHKDVENVKLKRRASRERKGPFFRPSRLFLSTPQSMVKRTACETCVMCACAEEKPDVFDNNVYFCVFGK